MKKSVSTNGAGLVTTDDVTSGYGFTSFYTMYFWVLCDSFNKYQPYPQTALTGLYR
jgi:hypothetical protein